MTERVMIQMPAWAHRLHEPFRFRVLYGGRGSAKSWTVARHYLIESTKAPLQGLCVRETQESLADSVHRLLGNQIEDMRLPGWTIQRERIFNANGSEITFAGVRSDPAKIKSSEAVDWCWVEEGEKVSKASWDILVPTIRGKGIAGRGAEFAITFNPNRREDPTYQRFVANPSPDAQVIKANWRDNPWFPEALRKDKDHLALHDPDAYMHVWEGEPIMRSDSQVLRGKWKIIPFEPVPGMWDGPYYGMDFGFAADPTHVVEVWRHMNALYIRREAAGARVDIDRYCELLARFPGVEVHALRCDCSRPESISYLQRHGFPRAIGPAKLPVEDGVAWLRSHDEIIIHPECPKIAEEAKRWSHKVDRLTDDVLPELVDADNHGWDAVRYALEPAIRGHKYQQRSKLDFSSDSSLQWG